MDGVSCCCRNNWSYTGGSYSLDFVYVNICCSFRDDNIHYKHGVDEYNVSEYKYWNAINLYDDYITAHWHELISAEQVKKFANETEVSMILEKIKSEFKRAVGLKWKKIFKKS